MIVPIIAPNCYITNSVFPIITVCSNFDKLSAPLGFNY